MTTPHNRMSVSQEEAESAVRVLLRWIGEDPQRQGLQKTPQRVIRSFQEYFSGYAENPRKTIARAVFKAEYRHEMVVLRNVRFESHCEHHLAPIVGKVHLAYLPDKRIVGISKLARVVEIYAKRLQIQEKLTEQIAAALYETLEPLGAGVIVKAQHWCMMCRGVRKAESEMITSSLYGCLKTNLDMRREFMSFARE